MDKQKNPVIYALIGMLIMFSLIGAGYGVYRFILDKTPSETDDNTTITPEVTTTTTKTKVYFYMSPLDYNRSVNDLVAFERVAPVTLDANVNLIEFTMDQFLLGPNATEKANGYVLPFTLSGTSTCVESTSGSTYKYVISNATTLKLTICKDITPISQGEGYAGESLAAEGRVLKAIISTMKVGAITTVQVYDKNGNCYAPDSGQNSCI